MRMERRSAPRPRSPGIPRRHEYGNEYEEQHFRNHRGYEQYRERMDPEGYNDGPRQWDGKVERNHHRDDITGGYKKAAKVFYTNDPPSAESAVVETVFRKPKVYADVNEFDDDAPMIDRVPTAIGYHSDDSGEIYAEEKSRASRYSFDVRDGCDEYDDEEEPIERFPSMGDTEADDKYSKYLQEPNDNPTSFTTMRSLLSNDSDSCPAVWKSFSSEKEERGANWALEEAKRRARLNAVKPPTKNLWDRSLLSFSSSDRGKSGKSSQSPGVGVDPNWKRNSTQNGPPNKISMQSRSRDLSSIQSPSRDKSSIQSQSRESMEDSGRAENSENRQKASNINQAKNIRLTPKKKKKKKGWEAWGYVFNGDSSEKGSSKYSGQSKSKSVKSLGSTNKHPITNKIQPAVELIVNRPIDKPSQSKTKAVAPNKVTTEGRRKPVQGTKSNRSTKSGHANRSMKSGEGNRSMKSSEANRSKKSGEANRSMKSGEASRQSSKISKSTEPSKQRVKSSTKPSTQHIQAPKDPRPDAPEQQGVKNVNDDPKVKMDPETSNVEDPVKDPVEEPVEESVEETIEDSFVSTPIPLTVEVPTFEPEENDKFIQQVRGEEETKTDLSKDAPAEDINPEDPPNASTTMNQTEPKELTTFDGWASSIMGGLDSLANMGLKEPFKFLDWSGEEKKIEKIQDAASRTSSKKPRQHTDKDGTLVLDHPQNMKALKPSASLTLDGSHESEINNSTIKTEEVEERQSGMLLPSKTVSFDEDDVSVYEKRKLGMIIGYDEEPDSNVESIPAPSRQRQEESDQPGTDEHASRPSYTSRQRKASEALAYLEAAKRDSAVGKDSNSPKAKSPSQSPSRSQSRSPSRSPSGSPSRSATRSSRQVSTKDFSSRVDSPSSRELQSGTHGKESRKTEEEESRPSTKKDMISISTIEFPTPDFTLEEEEDGSISVLGLERKSVRRSFRNGNPDSRFSSKADALSKRSEDTRSKRSEVHSRSAGSKKSEAKITRVGSKKGKNTFLGKFLRKK